MLRSAHKQYWVRNLQGTVANSKSKESASRIDFASPLIQYSQAA
jgi:hypothetical protein